MLINYMERPKLIKDCDFERILVYIRTYDEKDKFVAICCAEKMAYARQLRRLDGLCQEMERSMARKRSYLRYRKLPSIRK